MANIEELTEALDNFIKRIDIITDAGFNLVCCLQGMVDSYVQDGHCNYCHENSDNHDPNCNMHLIQQLLWRYLEEIKKCTEAPLKAP